MHATKPSITLTSGPITVTAGTSWLTFSHPAIPGSCVRIRSADDLQLLGERLTSWLEGCASTTDHVSFSAPTQFQITCDRGDIILNYPGNAIMLGRTPGWNQLLVDLRDWLVHVTGQHPPDQGHGDPIQVAAGRIVLNDGTFTVQVDTGQLRQLAANLLSAAQRRIDTHLPLADTQSLETHPGAGNTTLFILRRAGEHDTVAILSPTATVRLAQRVAAATGR